MLEPQLDHVQHLIDCAERSKAESDPFHDPIELILFVLSCNKEPVASSWREVLSRSGRANSTMSNRFFRALDQHGWHLEKGKLTKLSEGEESNRVTGSRRPRSLQKAGNTGTISSLDQQNVVIPATTARGRVSSEPQEQSIVINDESPPLDNMEPSHHQQNEEASSSEEEHATVATATEVNNAAIKQRLQAEEDELWDW